MRSRSTKHSSPVRLRRRISWLTCNAKKCVITKFIGDNMLDLLVRFQINRSTVSQNLGHRSVGGAGKAYVASSRITTLELLTRARARLRSDLSPTLKFAPSGSITVSRVIGTLLPDVSERPRREDRRSASHSWASSYKLKGSKTVRTVPLKISGCPQICR